MQPAYLLASSQDTQFWTSFEGQRQVPVCSFLLLEDAFLLPHVPVEGKYSPIPVLQTPLKMKNILRIGIFKVAHKQYQQRQEQYNEVKFLQKNSPSYLSVPQFFVFFLCLFPSVSPQKHPVP